MEKEGWSVFAVCSAFRVACDAYYLCELLVACLHSGSWTAIRFTTTGPRAPWALKLLNPNPSP